MSSKKKNAIKKDINKVGGGEKCTFGTAGVGGGAGGANNTFATSIDTTGTIVTRLAVGCSEDTNWIESAISLGCFRRVCKMTSSFSQRTTRLWIHQENQENQENQGEPRL